MTGLLQKSIERVAALPQEEQDRLACILLAELESEQRLSEHIGRPESEAPRDRLAERDINHLKQKTLMDLYGVFSDGEPALSKSEERKAAREARSWRYR